MKEEDLRKDMATFETALEEVRSLKGVWRDSRWQKLAETLSLRLKALEERVTVLELSPYALGKHQGQIHSLRFLVRTEAELQREEQALVDRIGVLRDQLESASIRKKSSTGDPDIDELLRDERADRRMPTLSPVQGAE